MTYNGWTNYETWLTNLWFSDFTDVFNEFTEDGVFDDMTNDEIRTYVADYIEEYVNEYIDNNNSEDGFIADITGLFMSDVDWQDIAGHYVDDISVDVAVRNRELEAV